MTQYDQQTPTSSGPGAAAQTAKEQAGDVAGTARDAAQRVAEQAQSSAGDVTREAQDQLSGLWDQTRQEMSGRASTQQQRLAGGMQTFAGDLHTMASSADGGVAAEVVRRVAEQSRRAGEWLAAREPDDVLHEVRAFARRRPGTFLLVAAGAGVLVGRLSRALKDAPPRGEQRRPGPTVRRTPTGVAPDSFSGEPRHVAAPERVGATQPPAFPPTTARPAPTGGTAFPTRPAEPFGDGGL